ncbi:unnamed protein product [Prorocentrum cordatum]|uniref:Helicase C-terminal domain-containing protein n=1 Tax=Prorocentrum cordatum TaxID=2364126 RepID=A0ABN9WXX3_9DINO|nr:unnamed protein product [Polarella glacialis]
MSRLRGPEVGASVPCRSELPRGEARAPTPSPVGICALRLPLRGLQTVGIPPLRLAGNPRQQKQALSDFAAGSSAEEFALLLTFEQCCGGLGLASARHVMLVHPACSEHAAGPVEQEMQAIGRVLRQGRRGPVHVHRFSAKCTVEEVLARQHQEACCRASAHAAGGLRSAG